MKSWEMNQACPGCGEKHKLVYEGTDTPSNLDQLQYKCPVNNKDYRVTHGDIPVWMEEFGLPEGAVIATKFRG